MYVREGAANGVGKEVQVHKGEVGRVGGWARPDGCRPRRRARHKGLEQVVRGVGENVCWTYGGIKRAAPSPERDAAQKWEGKASAH